MKWRTPTRNANDKRHGDGIYVVRSFAAFNCLLKKKTIEDRRTDSSGSDMMECTCRDSPFGKYTIIAFKDDPVIVILY